MSRDVFTLSESVRLNHTISVRCGCCGRRIWFAPEDFLRLLGDVPCSEIDRHMSCSGCGTGDHVRVCFERLPAGERQRVRLRRIKQIRMVRKVIWEDEP